MAVLLLAGAMLVGMAIIAGVGWRRSLLDDDLLAAARERDFNRIVELVDRGANVRQRIPTVYIDDPPPDPTLLDRIKSVLHIGSPRRSGTPILNELLVADSANPKISASLRAAVDALIAHGANVNEEDSYGLRPLILAAGTGDEALFKELMNNGAVIPGDARARNFAMSEAVRGGSISILTLLLDGGCDPNSGLVSAAGQGRADMVRLLLARGGNPNYPSGFKPIDVALRVPRHRHEDVAVELLKAGADPTIVAPDGRCPMEYPVPPQLRAEMRRAAKRLHPGRRW